MKLHRTTSGWFLEDSARFHALPSFSLDQLLRRDDPVQFLKSAARNNALPALPSRPTLPAESQEIWAVGVTYLRSKAARMEESDFSATAYDKVYDAPRPELFFKATPRRCAGPDQSVRIRADSKWNVPEPELTLVISASRQLVGFTLGNDMSSRDIEGENLLYLPQAKIWDGCCALGPAILINDGQTDIRATEISLQIRRDNAVAFAGSTPISRIKRTFDELIDYLFRDQSFPDGVFLLTGTGIVPPDDFTLRKGDEIEMEIPEIGRLRNRVD